MKVKGEPKKTLITWILLTKHSTTWEITHLKSYRLKSRQLAIIQAFAALWKLKIKEMVVILNFCQRIEINDVIIPCYYIITWFITP